MKDKKTLLGISSTISFVVIVFISLIVMFINYWNNDKDACIDHGGCWNESEQQCEMQDNSKRKKLTIMF